MLQQPMRGSWAALRSTLLALACAVAVACGTSVDAPDVAFTTINGVACLDGAVACGDSCAQLSSSSQHCGACDHSCSDGSICDRGRCRDAASGCSERLSLCGSDCLDLGSDHEHCGACDRGCPDEAECAAGACLCPDQLTACGDACVDTESDAEHCGSCLQACLDTQTCNQGSCQCPAGTELCSPLTLVAVDAASSAAPAVGTCVDPQTDSQHCGGCGIRCSNGRLCEQGSCVCPMGQTLCGDSCSDTGSSLENCGSCGHACVGGQFCSSGACACPDGQTSCDGSCIDTQADDANCGGCGQGCGLGQGCTNGSCQSGALGEDGCQGLALNLDITQVAAYQTVKVALAQNGQLVNAPAPGMVAQRPTLFRVFVTPGAGWLPRELSARLFLDQGDAVVTQYSETTLSVAAASVEDDRTTTFEFLVPAERITAETRFAVEVVECGSGSGTLLSPRVPATGAANLGALDTGGLRLHLVPLRSNGLLPDTSDAALALYKSAFLDTYPISAIDISVGAAIDIADPEDWNGNLDTLRALRQREAPAPDVYYYGMLKPANTLREFCGNGCVAGVGFVVDPRLGGGPRAAMGLAYADVTAAFTMLHEVGHNHGRNHAPCAPGGNITGVDANFPQNDGSIGVYGYNALGDQLLPPEFTDLMGYCQNQWLSAYTYGGLLNAVLTVNQVQASELGDPARLAAWRVLLVDSTRGARWGVGFDQPAEASGLEEPALVFDAAGAPIETVSVYRTGLGDLDASSIEVPEPRPGWHSIQVAGAAPIEFARAP